jgi:hypothetical protein
MIWETIAVSHIVRWAAKKYFPALLSKAAIPGNMLEEEVAIKLPEWEVVVSASMRFAFRSL